MLRIGPLAWRVRLAIVVPGGVDRSGTGARHPRAPLADRAARAAPRRPRLRARAGDASRPTTRCSAPGSTTSASRRARAGRERLSCRPGALVRGLSGARPVRLLHAFWANNPGFLAALAARRSRDPVRPEPRRRRAGRAARHPLRLAASPPREAEGEMGARPCVARDGRERTDGLARPRPRGRARYRPARRSGRVVRGAASARRVAPAPPRRQPESRQGRSDGAQGLSPCRRCAAAARASTSSARTCSAARSSAKPRRSAWRNA